MKETTVKFHRFKYQYLFSKIVCILLVFLQKIFVLSTPIIFPLLSTKNIALKKKVNTVWILIGENKGLPFNMSLKQNTNKMHCYNQHDKY